MKLSKELEENFEIINNELRLKKDYKFDSSKLNKDVTFNEDIIIPRNEIFLLPFSKDGSIITRVCKKISHSYLLVLKNKYDIEFEKYDLISNPNDNDEGYGYVRIKVKDTDIVGDGEICRADLPNQWKQYALTIMFKRAEDRAICKYLGLYSEGFYTEGEFINPQKDEKPLSVDYNDIKIGEVTEYTFSDKNVSSDNVNSNTEADNELSKNDMGIIVELLSALLKETEDQFKDTIKKITDKNSIFDCTKIELQNLLDHYEKEFENDEQLFQLLSEEIKNYKIDQNWSQEKLLDEISKSLNMERKGLKISDLTVDDCYDMILDWGI